MPEKLHFAATVSGSRLEQGVAGFSEIFIEDIAALRDYVLAQAWSAYEPQQSGNLSGSPVP